MMTAKTIVLIAIILLVPSSRQPSMLSSAFSANIFDSQCSCGPEKIVFRIDLEKTCDDTVLGENVQSYCGIHVSNKSLVDRKPVGVRSITVMELDERADVVNIKNMLGPFSHGDTFEFNSVALSMLSTVSTTGSTLGFPSGIQVELNGFNADGEDIRNQWLVQYKISCSEEPFNEAEHIGWSVVDHIVHPSPNFCPSRRLLRDGK